MTDDLGNDLRSNYLFARPSFIEGVGRIVDLYGSMNSYNAAPTPEEADARALYEDWKAVGHDLRVAVEQVRAGAGVGLAGGSAT